MPFDITDQLRIDVLSGKARADELPSQKAAKAARDAEAAERSRLSAPIFRDAGRGRQVAVPTAVLNAERADGVQRVYVEGTDREGYPYSGWYKPAPPKSEAVLREESRIGEPLTFDYFTGRYVPWLSLHSPMPLDMKAQADEWFPDELDPRRPTYSARTHTWSWPEKAKIPEQEPARREDLVSPSGFPLDYWNEPKGGGA
jgi:hypothetical protein